MNTSNFAVATDLTTYGPQVPEWVQLFPVGSWQDTPQGQPWNITPQVLQDLKTNFDQGTRQVGVPLDCNHKGGAAPGWVKELAVRPDGLWGRIDWTPLGQQLVSEKQFRYLSPSWNWSWTRPSDGQVFQNVLESVALTNNPFFSTMNPLVAQASAHTSVCMSGTPVQQGGLSDEGRRVELVRLAHEHLRATGCDYGDACRAVFVARPDLLPASAQDPPGPGAAAPDFSSMSSAEASAEIHALASSRLQGTQVTAATYAEAVRAVMSENAALRAAYVGGNERPQNAELHQLALARLGKDYDADTYAAAVKAVVAERPDLHPCYSQPSSASLASAEIARLANARAGANCDADSFAAAAKAVMAERPDLARAHCGA